MCPMADQTLAHNHLFYRLAVWLLSHHRVVQVEGVEDKHLRTGNHNDPNVRHLYMTEGKPVETKGRNKVQIAHIHLPLRRELQAL